ncbi:hypothetical protein JP0116_12510 [Helicobacter pylori]|nr:hypothetical protein JP0116_12510 [Helicobacter pylori]
MVSLIIASPLNLDLVSKTAKNHHTLEWSIDVFEHSYYTTYTTILGIFSLIIVNIEKFPSLQAFRRLGTIHIFTHN